MLVPRKPCEGCQADITDRDIRTRFCKSCLHSRRLRQRREVRRNRNATRECLDCFVNIGTIHLNSKRCPTCQAVRKKALVKIAGRQRTINIGIEREAEKARKEAAMAKPQPKPVQPAHVHEVPKDGICEECGSRSRITKGMCSFCARIEVNRKGRYTKTKGKLETNA